MKKLLLLFTFCLLLANTELRAQVYVLPTTDNDKLKLIRIVLECYQQCYSDYAGLGWVERVDNCIKYYPSEYCTEERLRARAREEYEMCISFCQVLERLLRFIP